MVWFETIAGDYKLRENNLIMGGQIDVKPVPKRRVKLTLNDIALVELIDEETARTAGRTIGLALAGALVAGPLGLAAGFFGKKSEVRFALLFKDGTRLVGCCTPKAFRKLTKPLVLSGRYAGPGMTILEGMRAS